AEAFEDLVGESLNFGNGDTQGLDSRRRTGDGGNLMKTRARRVGREGEGRDVHRFTVRLVLLQQPKMRGEQLERLRFVPELDLVHVLLAVVPRDQVLLDHLDRRDTGAHVGGQVLHAFQVAYVVEDVADVGE